MDITRILACHSSLTQNALGANCMRGLLVGVGRQQAPWPVNLQRGDASLSLRTIKNLWQIAEPPTFSAL